MPEKPATQLTPRNFLDGSYDGVLYWYSPFRFKCDAKNHYYRKRRQQLCQCQQGRPAHRAEM